MLTGKNKFPVKKAGAMEIFNQINIWIRFHTQFSLVSFRMLFPAAPVQFNADVRSERLTANFTPFFSSQFSNKKFETAVKFILWEFDRLCQGVLNCITTIITITTGTITTNLAAVPKKKSSSITTIMKCGLPSLKMAV